MSTGAFTGDGRQVIHWKENGLTGPLMKDYHEVRGHPWPTMGTRTKGEEIQRNGQRVVVFQIEGFDERRYPVAMVWDGERLRVDWESLTAYGATRTGSSSLRIRLASPRSCDSTSDGSPTTCNRRLPWRTGEPSSG